MKRFGLVAAFIAALVALGTPAAAWASKGHHHHHNNTFTVVVRDADAAVAPADFFTAAPQPNAQATEDAPVYDGNEKIGLAETVYTITRVAGDDVDVMVECSVELPDGNLLFNGTTHLADVTSGTAFPVVGGTGAYARARGVVTATGAADGSTTTLDFDISTK
jgi:hypothetical protein